MLLSEIMLSLELILCFLVASCTVSILLFYHTLLFSRYLRVHLCVYSRSITCHTSLSYSADDGSPATLWNCREIKCFLNDVSRQQTFHSLLLDCTVTETRHINKFYDHYCPFERFHPFPVIKIAQAKRLLDDIVKTIYTWNHWNQSSWTRYSVSS